jgi:hypothetical protein
MEMISIKHPNSSNHPNMQWSGASVTSELCSKVNNSLIIESQLFMTQICLFSRQLLNVVKF